LLHSALNKALFAAQVLLQIHDSRSQRAAMKVTTNTQSCRRADAPQAGAFFDVFEPTIAFGKKLIVKRITIV
jgi:hypothetical protein